MGDEAIGNIRHSGRWARKKKNYWRTNHKGNSFPVMTQEEFNSVLETNILTLSEVTFNADCDSVQNIFVGFPETRRSGALSNLKRCSRLSSVNFGSINKEITSSVPPNSCLTFDVILMVSVSTGQSKRNLVPRVSLLPVPETLGTRLIKTQELRKTGCQVPHLLAFPF